MKNPGSSRGHVFKIEKTTTDDDAYSVRVPGLSEKLTTLEIFAKKTYARLSEKCRTAEDRNVTVAATLVTNLTLRAAEFDPSVS